MILAFVSIAVGADPAATIQSLEAENATLRGALSAMRTSNDELIAANDELRAALAEQEASTRAQAMATSSALEIVDLQREQAELWRAQLDVTRQYASDWERLYRAEASRNGTKVERYIWVGLSATLGGALIWQGVSR